MAKTVVVARRKVEKNLVVSDKTKITKSKQDLTFADLKAGMSVALEYQKEGDKLIAVTIKVAAPKAAAKK